MNLDEFPSEWNDDNNDDDNNNDDDSRVQWKHRNTAAAAVKVIFSKKDADLRWTQVYITGSVHIYMRCKTVLASRNVDRAALIRTRRL